MANNICLPIDTFFKKMVDAHAFELRNGKLPAYIAPVIDGKEYHVPPGGDGGYIDGLSRVASWLKSSDDYPECVNLTFLDQETTTTIPPVNNPTGWDLTGIYQGDYQNNSVNCGPSSVLMMLSALGYTTTEEKIAQLAGTSAAGTDHAGLFKAAKSIAPTLNYAEYTLNYLGFQGIANHIKAGCEVIIHEMTGSLTEDADGQECWVNDYGHYTFVVGVNMALKRIKIFDPTKGLRDFYFSQMEKAMKAVTWDESILAFCNG